MAIPNNTDRWSDPLTIEDAAEELQVDPKPYGDSVKALGMSLEIFGQQFTNKKDAKRVFKRELRTKDDARKRQVQGPRQKLAMVQRRRAGVLDAQIARAISQLPKIELRAAQIKSLLEGGEIEGYYRSRLERELANLETRRAKHQANKEVCTSRLNELYSTKSA